MAQATAPDLVVVEGQSAPSFTLQLINSSWGMAIVRQAFIGDHGKCNYPTDEELTKRLLDSAQHPLDEYQVKRAIQDKTSVIGAFVQAERSRCRTSLA